MPALRTTKSAYHAHGIHSISIDRLLAHPNTPLLQYSNTPVLQTPLLHHSNTPIQLPLPSFDFVQRRLQRPFQIGHIEPYSSGAVQSRDTDHDQIESLSRRRLIGMGVQVVVNPLFERVKVSQTNNGR